MINGHIDTQTKRKVHSVGRVWHPNRPPRVPLQREMTLRTGEVPEWYLKLNLLPLCHYYRSKFMAPSYLPFISCCPSLPTPAGIQVPESDTGRSSRHTRRSCVLAPQGMSARTIAMVSHLGVITVCSFLSLWSTRELIRYRCRWIFENVSRCSLRSSLIMSVNALVNLPVIKNKSLVMFVWTLPMTFRDRGDKWWLRRNPRTHARTPLAHWHPLATNPALTYYHQCHGHLNARMHPLIIKFRTFYCGFYFTIHQ